MVLRWLRGSRPVRGPDPARPLCRPEDVRTVARVFAGHRAGDLLGLLGALGPHETSAPPPRAERLRALGALRERSAARDRHATRQAPGWAAALGSARVTPLPQPGAASLPAGAAAEVAAALACNEPGGGFGRWVSAAPGWAPVQTPDHRPPTGPGRVRRRRPSG